jgi:hypothetical protein
MKRVLVVPWSSAPTNSLTDPSSHTLGNVGAFSHAKRITGDALIR